MGEVSAHRRRNISTKNGGRNELEWDEHIDSFHNNVLVWITFLWKFKSRKSAFYEEIKILYMFYWILNESNPTVFTYFACKENGSADSLFSVKIIPLQEAENPISPDISFSNKTKGNWVYYQHNQESKCYRV